MKKLTIAGDLDCEGKLPGRKTGYVLKIRTSKGSDYALKQSI
jgi:hypothetical protein